MRDAASGHDWLGFRQDIQRPHGQAAPMQLQGMPSGASSYIQDSPATEIEGASFEIWKTGVVKKYSCWQCLLKSIISDECERGVLSPRVVSH